MVSTPKIEPYSNKQFDKVFFMFKDTLKAFNDFTFMLQVGAFNFM